MHLCTEANNFRQQHRKIWRYALLLCFTSAIAVSLCLLLTQKAQAHSVLALHAQYDHSNPAANARLPAGKPPASVQVWFTETIDPHFSNLKVYNQSRQRVDNDDSHMVANNQYSLVVSLRPHLPDAAYTVVYDNISSEDGHHVVGAFSFVVGNGALPTNTDTVLSQAQNADTNVNVWSVGIRWLNYLAMAGLLGTIAFIVLVWRPTYIARQKDIGAGLNKMDVALELRAAQIAIINTIALFILACAFLFYQAATASESAVWNIVGNGALMTLLLQSRFGAIWWARILLILVVSAVIFMSYRALTRKARRPRLLYTALLVLSVAIMATTSLDAHAAAKQPAWLLVSLDVVHLICTGIWIGGLFCLVILLPAGIRLLNAHNGERVRVLATLIPRFSVTAIVSVLLLIITGTIAALTEIPSFAALYESSYGRTLLVKLCLVVVLLALGAFHLLWVSPRMRALAQQDNDTEQLENQADKRLQERFKRSIRFEALFAVLLLIVVGLLTSLSPPPPTALANGANSNSTNSTQVRQGKAGDLLYSLIINPGKLGENTFEVSLRQSNGQPLRTADDIELRFIMLDMDMGEQVLPLTPVANRPGYYRASDASLSMTGNWEIDLLVRRSGYDDVTAHIRFVIG
jgi:copper transport protein